MGSHLVDREQIPRPKDALDEPKPPVCLVAGEDAILRGHLLGHINEMLHLRNESPILGDLLRAYRISRLRFTNQDFLVNLFFI